MNNPHHARLFRKKALEKLSSPDQLDQLLEITSSKGWIALGAVGFCIIMAIVWGIKGQIPTKVNAQGIIIKKGGVFDVVSLGTGLVSSIHVATGDIVEKGDLIARLEQPDQANQVSAMEEKIKNMTERYEFVRDNKDIVSKSEFYDQQKVLIESSIETLKKNLSNARERVKSQQLLLKDGIITKNQLLSAQSDVDTIIQGIESKKNELNQIDLTKNDLAQSRETELKTLSQQLEESKTTLANMKEAFKISSEIISTYQGRVIELKIKPGSLVNAGLPIVTLELADEESSLEAILYISPMDGKKVSTDMEALVAPTTIKTEEYGYMKGEVTYVSQYPTTSQQMMLRLQNKELVATLTQGGAPFEMNVSLIPNPKALSGYTWTSPLGPPIQVQSGTMCTATITVKKQKPISLVIPWFKKKTGLE